MHSLHLQHFRCFEGFNLAFKPGINLLVGDNASGKTSLLKACQYILSSFFAGFSDENTQWITFDQDDFERIVSGDMILSSESIHISFDMEDLIQEIAPEIPHTTREAFKQLTLERRSTKNARTLRRGFNTYYQYAQRLQRTFYDLKEKRHVKPLPLFAFYSVEDIHKKRRFDKNSFLLATARHSLGYLGCLDGDGFLPYWIRRLLILEERQPGHQESSFVKKQVLRVLGEAGCDLFKDILIRPNAREVVFVTCDGREAPTDYLSEGQKRVIAIAIDLAFRSYLLNYSLYGEETGDKITGTVLIDEVDMHLHPSLQGKILPALQQAYPRVQFIVSSHAPMVMSGIESNERNIVYKLSFTESEGYRAEEVRTYGIDLSTLVERLWQLPTRSPEVANRLQSLFDKIDAELYDDARKLLDKLRKDFPNGELSELTYAENMLDFLTSDIE